MLTAGAILWTAEVERALADQDLGSRRALKALRKKWVGYLNKLTALTRGKLEPVDRAKVCVFGRPVGVLDNQTASLSRRPQSLTHACAFSACC